MALFHREDVMSMLLWILLGLSIGLIASKLVKTTGEGTVVDCLLGIVGAILGGWLFSLFSAADSSVLSPQFLSSAAAAIVGAIVLLVIYHVAFRHRMT
jgi:uncharacterized membrane protein YeaQ/YmgE (transglycosylase-associated protein family)